MKYRFFGPSPALYVAFTICKASGSFSKHQHIQVNKLAFIFISIELVFLLTIPTGTVLPHYHNPTDPDPGLSWSRRKFNLVNPNQHVYFCS